MCQQMDACMDPTGGSWPTAQPLYTSPPPPHFTIFLEVNPASSSRWRRQRPRAVPSAAPVVMNDCTVLGIRLDQCNPAAAYAAARKSQIQQEGELFLLQRPDSTGGGADAEEHVTTLSGVSRPLLTRQALLRSDTQRK